MEEPVLCRHQARCGGCPLMPLPYPEQLANKEARVRAELAPYENLSQVAVAPIAGAEAPLEYRVRAKLVVAKPNRIGLFTGPDHEVEDIPECRVLSASLLATTNALRRVLTNPPQSAGSALIAFDPRGNGALSAFDLREVRQNGVPHVLLTLILVRERRVAAEQLRAAADALRRETPLASVSVSYRAAGAVQVLGSTPELLAGSALQADEIGGVTHMASAGSFVQVHREQAGVLHERVANGLEAALGGLRGRRILELYAGSGAIGFSLARRGADVILAEEQPVAVNAARARSSGSLEIICCDAAEAAEQLCRAGTRIDAVIVDPPRRGLAPHARAAIARLAPSALVYVSCNPSTLARDLDQLALFGFRTSAVQPIDMIPQTAEVETLTVLTRGAVLSPKVLYENAELIVCDKPAHESTTPQGERESSLLARVRTLPRSAEATPIHRLDAETSGVCLLARTADSVAHFADLLASGQKRYVALVRGVAPSKGVINRPIREGGRDYAARTRYKRLARVGGHSLVAVMPDQGRKHQIRRHLASIGHPVIGDRRHGHADTNRYFEERYGLDRLFLHCQRIELGSRAAGDTNAHLEGHFAFESPLPAELQSILDALAERGSLPRPLKSRRFAR